MPVSSGAPLVFQELVDLVTANYPAFVALLDPDQTGTPLLFAPAANPDMSKGFLLAMICPPNMTTPPATIGAFSLWNNTDTSRIGVLFDIGHPIIAPDTFVTLTSGTYADSVGGDGSAQADLAVQVDNYRIANPNVRALGQYTSQYRNLAPPDPLFFAVSRLCGKTMP